MWLTISKKGISKPVISKVVWPFGGQHKKVHANPRESHQKS
jgi:hypothetical protein